MGWIIFNLGVFRVLFASIVGKSTGFLRLIIDTIHLISKERKENLTGNMIKILCILI